jgi:hypothetical protein
VSALAQPFDDDDHGPLNDARLALQFGVLWGLATVGMESMAVPFDVLSKEPVGFFAALTTSWCLTCTLVAWVALRLDRRYRGVRLVVGMLLAALPISWVPMACMNYFLPESGMYVLRRGADPLSRFCYDAWATLFYGSLLAMACIVTRRSSRTRRLLKQAEIDRGLTDAMLAEIRLKELQGSVNPEVLHDALAEVRRRYVAGSTTSDHLLDDLVGFLRVAMPSLRGSASTLGAELELTRAYLRLREQLYPHQGAWRIEAADDLATLAVPPLQLVDAIDRWVAASGGSAAGVVSISRSGDTARVDLGPLTPDDPTRAPRPIDADADANSSTQRRPVPADEPTPHSTARETSK